MRRIRLAIVGFGTVGRWLAEAVHRRRRYRGALAAAQAQGYAEPNPADDVEGHDSVAKARILAAIAFGATVGLDRVSRRGIAGMSSHEVLEAARAGARVRLVVTIAPATPRARTGGSMPIEIRVEPVALPLADPLSRVDGVMNALAIETDTVNEVIVIGPGAGRSQAGQGMFADLAALARAS